MQEDQKAVAEDVQAQFLYEYASQISAPLPICSAAQSRSPSEKLRLQMQLQSGSKRISAPTSATAMSSWLTALQLIQAQPPSDSPAGLDATLQQARDGSIAGLSSHKIEDSP